MCAPTVLFLGYSETETRLIEFLQSEGCTVTHRADPITPDDAATPDLIVSFGYRHILKPDVLAAARRPILNLHIAYLPYNRGAHPNFWAFLDGTPHGVTIHHVNAGIDTGNIVAQREVKFDDLSQSFADTHSALLREIEMLFIENWPVIRDGAYRAKPQSGAGTAHRKADLPGFAGGWDARISNVLKELKK